MRYSRPFPSDYGQLAGCLVVSLLFPFLLGFPRRTLLPFPGSQASGFYSCFLLPETKKGEEEFSPLLLAPRGEQGDSRLVFPWDCVLLGPSSRHGGFPSLAERPCPASSPAGLWAGHLRTPARLQSLCLSVFERSLTCYAWLPSKL